MQGRVVHLGFVQVLVAAGGELCMSELAVTLPDEGILDLVGVFLHGSRSIRVPSSTIIRVSTGVLHINGTSKLDF